MRDQRTDLAVLRLKGASGLSSMELDDSDTLEVGDIVLAIGNPFGVGQTVTQGIVSALARTQIGATDAGFFIQTDAAINPGNSGGALVDMNGRLAGINSSIFSQTGSSVGIGFAIPANTVRAVIATAKSGGTLVHRPWLGANLQVLSKDLADSMGLDRPSGALVTDVAAGSPAAEAGVKRGDVITAVDGQTIDDPEGFGYRIGTKMLGGTASLSILRGGKAILSPMRLIPAPENPSRDAVRLKGPSPFQGATVVNLSPAVAEELSIPLVEDAVAVAEIESGSTAEELNVQKGDVVLSINDTRIVTTKEMDKATAARRSSWKITVRRGGEVFTTRIGG